MSNTIYPETQLPTPCDFGPFFGGYCGKVVTIDFSQARSNIKINSVNLNLIETSTMTIDLSTLVTSVMPLDWTKTTFTHVSGNTNGVRTYDPATTIMTYKPDITPSSDRVVVFEYHVVDSIDFVATGTITINIVDQSPVLTAGPITLSGVESKIYTIDVSQSVVMNFTTVNYLDPNAAIISVQPTEGKATILNGVITYTPIITPTNTRTVTMKYKVTSIDGLTSESTISITLSDDTPVITTVNLTKTTMDNVNLTGSILSAITLKFDTFKSLSFGPASEGSISATGSNFTYIPDSSITTATRTVTIPYTVTTTSGLTSTSNLIINITDYNKFANAIWYGNSVDEFVTKAMIERDLTPVVKSAYAGTYSLTSGVGVYKWVVYPKSWGETPTIIDAVTLMEIAMDNFVNITIDGVTLVAFRTYYQVNGAINFKIF